jgi:hypothetical protein
LDDDGAEFVELLDFGGEKARLCAVAGYDRPRGKSGGSPL